MDSALPQQHPLRTLFAGLTEQAFVSQMGIADPPLVDYITDLLARFLHVDQVFRLRDSGGRPISELVLMALEAQKLPAEGRTRREYHRHIGDFALYYSGLFPEAVNRFQQFPSKDHLVNFTRLGKRSYQLASEMDRDRFADESALLQRLGHDFELCTLGLREVRHEWEELARHPQLGARLLH